MRTMTAAAFVLLAQVAAMAAENNTITVHKRSRAEQPGGKWAIQEKTEAWQPAETAIIVCDMWDSHHCLNAVRRAVEMAPRMNAVLTKAREVGVLVIHAPSGCMETYQDHPGRKLAQTALTAGNLPTDIAQWCRVIPAEEKGTYPIDQTKGGEDDDLEEHQQWQEKLAALGRNPKSPWKAELSLLTIDDRDAISDSGVEIWNLIESRGIKNVILLGVHTNMCVLGRPFGLRQMAKNGKNVVLMRDMTDTMYDPAQWPYVNHFTGTHLIIEHIEKFVCPTITSVAFLGGEEFRFARDKRKVLMLIGDDEYKTEVTLPAFVESDLKPLGFDVQIIHSDPQDKNKFPGMAEAIKAADVVFVSVRRRLPPKDQLDALRQHVAAGKPVVGIRTACHAWCLRTAQENQAAAEKGHGVWPEFDPEVLGGHYTGHYGAGAESAISVADGATNHAILRGIDAAKLIGNGSLYKVKPLVETTAPLLVGTIPDQQPEAVAWTNVAGPNKARVFNTTLGHWDDFQDPAFRKLLTNAIFWALGEPYPVGQDVDKLLPRAAGQQK
ncbi:MAG: ThuA domain-containing protein [Planctomycetes bacterium]|nr:ThuA domain-containing protein [Planctomycetota bacterium]